MQMVGHCDRDGIDRVIVENAAEIGHAVRAAGCFYSLGKSFLIDIIHMHDLGIA